MERPTRGVDRRLSTFFLAICNNARLSFVLDEMGKSVPVGEHTLKGLNVMIRANWFAVSPDGAKAIGGLHHYVVNETNLPSTLIHLVFLRVSQINGCAHCIDIHTRDLLKEGMSVDKAVLVPVWHEAGPLFTEQECAALAWSEEVTRVSETHASDHAYAAALAVFGEKDLVDLTLTIAAMNAINRLGVSFRLKPRARS